MKIIGGYDYYDTAGIRDEEIFFVRKQEVFKDTPFISDGILGNVMEIHRKKTSSFVIPIIVIFCGKIYPVVCVQHYYHGEKFQDYENSQWQEKFSTKKRQIFYNVNDLFEYLPPNFLKGRIYRFGGFRTRIDFFKTHFNRQISAAQLDWVLEKRIVVGMTDIVIGRLENVDVISNFDKLTNLEFYKIFDAPTAHQEVSMFVSGVLSNNPKIEEISNESKITKAGFDLKTSFRN